MKIIINTYDANFLYFLIDKIKKYIIRNIKFNKLIPIEKVMNSSPEYQSLFVKHISCRQVIYSAIHNLTFKRYQNISEILIDENVYLYGTNIKLIDACNFITYGNLQVRGYSIIKDAFDDIANNFTKYQEKYLTRGF